jgi:hypothetical protein
MEERNPESPDWSGIVAVFATALLVLALINVVVRGTSNQEPSETLAGGGPDAPLRARGSVAALPR